MNNNLTNPFGKIIIEEQAIISAAIEAALSCYGVVSVAALPASKKNEEFFAVGPNVGVTAKKKDGMWSVTLYLNLIYGIKLTEIIGAIQDQIKYNLEKQFDTKLKAVNIYIVGVVER